MRAGLSQRALAAAAGVGLRTVREIERGRVRSPRPATMERLLRAAADPGPWTVDVLGGLRVRHDGVPVEIRSPQAGAVLAVLALHHDRPATVDEVAAVLWDGERPRSYANLVQTYVSRLRAATAPGLVVSGAGGYRLAVPRDAVDACRFRDLLAAGARDRALDCWAGFVPAAPYGEGPVPARLHRCPAAAGLVAARAALADDPDVEVRLLGPVAAWVGPHRVPARSRSARTLLAALALDPGRVVPVERLVDLLWGAAPPRTAREQVHTQVSRLRRAFRDAGAGGVLVTGPDGYRLDRARVTTDLQDVARLLAAADEADAAARPRAAVRALATALAQWPGPELDGVAAALAETEVPRLAELRAATIERRVAGELDLGNAAAVVADLETLVRTHPLREGLHRLRMLALHRSGRRADALAAYGHAARTLRDELGVEPSAALRELVAELRAGPGEAAGETARASGPPPHARPAGPVPAQLPPAVPVLAGRDAETAVLATVLAAPAGRIVLVTGLPGTGATALAVHAATGAGATYPDGRLHADLAAPGGDPAAVLGRFLEALGTPRDAIPAGLAERVAAFRTRTADTRTLVLLDGASRDDQVAALRPSGPGCVTLVTSTRPLTGADAAGRVRLGPVPDADAYRVLAGVAGADRLAADPVAAAAVVRACAGLPLALRLAGERLVALPHLPLSRLAARLAADPLAVLRSGERSVSAGLAAAVAALDAPVREVLGGCAALPGPVVDVADVAALLGLPLDRAEDAADELVAAHLLDPVAGAVAGAASRHRLPGLLLAYLTRPAHATRRSALTARS